VQAQEQRSDTTHISVKTILVVEDDVDIGSFIVLAISQETNHYSQLVTDGFQALKVTYDLKPDLLILDYQLPHMNGIELYDKLQARKDLADIPTIMISARLPTQEIARRNITGVKKPFELTDLLRTIEEKLAS
jgi:DNA-binding response OmpR family regulator